MKYSVIALLLCLSALNQAQNCVDPLLIDPGSACPTVLDPVCGCNGVTYSNSCFAQNIGGVTSWIQGNCSAQSNCQLTNNITTTPSTSTLFESTQLTYSNSTLQANTDIVMESEAEVFLDNGFCVGMMTDFKAEIDNCNDIDLCIGDCSQSMDVATTLYMHNGGNIELWYKGNASLCPSSAINAILEINGVVVYNQIIEVADVNQNPTASFIQIIQIPALSNIDLQLNLVQTTIPSNQGISCLVLGSTQFGLSF